MVIMQYRSDALRSKISLKNGAQINFPWFCTQSHFKIWTNDFAVILKVQKINVRPQDASLVL